MTKSEGYTSNNGAAVPGHLLVLLLTGMIVSPVLQAQQAAPPEQGQRQEIRDRMRAAPTQKPVGRDAVVVELDNTGVADWKFLNARQPPLVATAAELVFVNTTFYRTIKVTLPTVTVPASAPPESIEARVNALATEAVRSPGQNRQTLNADSERELGVVLGLDNCANANPGTTCTPVVTLGPNTPAAISTATLGYYRLDSTTKESVLKFTVEFFDDEQQPARATGYFSVQEKVRDTAPSGTWTAAASLQLARDPFFAADKATPIDADHQYQGDQVNQVKGFARASMAYQLGTRAAGYVDFLFKNNTALGTFTPSASGPVAEDFAVKAPQYHFTVFALNGASLKFGKYDFAIPTDGLAIRESGEGATLRYRWVAASHIVRRESKAGVADPDNQDHKVWLVESNNVDLHLPVLRSASLYGLYGLDNNPSRERRYRTIGGETLFDLRGLIEGQFAYYRSRSKPHEDSAAIDAEGSSFLLRLSHAWFSDHKMLRNVAATFARGSGDVSGTPNRFEGYLGETANYTGEPSLYVGAVVPRLRVDSGGDFPRRGLVNRRILATAYTDQEWSPLATLARLIGIPQHDIQSRQTTIRYLNYGFSEAVEGSGASSFELQLETLLESPRGVKYSLRFSRLFPRGPLESFFAEGKEPWSMLAQCTVTLK